MKKMRRRCAPRVRMHANETMTLSGVDARDLRDILTSARLYRYQNPVTAEKNGQESVVWETRITYILDTLDHLILDRYHETYPWHNEPNTKQQRLEDVQETRRTRVLIDTIIKAELEKRR